MLKPKIFPLFLIKSRRPKALEIKGNKKIKESKKVLAQPKSDISKSWRAIKEKGWEKRRQEAEKEMAQI